MKLPLAKITLAVCLAVPLGACSSLFGSRTLARHSATAAETPALPASALAETPAAPAVAAPGVAAEAAATGEGRAHLAAGRYGLAIESFRTALAHGEPRAPALNGFGVAYANIGRFDLAQRFFLEAIKADPGEDRYAANLGRLMSSPAMVLRRDGDIAAVALRNDEEGRVGPQERQATVAAAPQRGRLSKVSSHEFRIVTVAPQTAPRAMAASRSAQGFKPLVRLDISRFAGGSTPLAPVPPGATASSFAASSRAGIGPGVAGR